MPMKMKKFRYFNALQNFQMIWFSEKEVVIYDEERRS